MKLENQVMHKILYLIAVIAVVFLSVNLVCLFYLRLNKVSMPAVYPMATSSPAATAEPSESPSAPIISPEPETVTFISVNWEKKWIPLNENCKGDCGYSGFLAGKETDGKFKNHDVYAEMEEGPFPSYRHYVLDNGEKIYFDEHNIKIKGIDDLPEEIDFSGTGYKLKKNYIHGQRFSEIKIEKKLFIDPIAGNVYLADSGCFVIELPNHTVLSYDLIIPFLADKGNGYSGATIDVAFDNGEKNKEEYTYNRIVGCGALCFYLNVADDKNLKPNERLAKTGKTSNGEDIFQIKDPNDPALKALYEDKNTVAYLSDLNSGGGDMVPKSKYTYDQFLKYRPLFYWKDPLGRWIEFKNNRFVIAAEMCKPVLYLYPSEKMNLKARVNPNGGMTYSDPVYGDGWNIEANPSGLIKDLITGKAYDYLFWEGIGLNYPLENKGWVVKKENLDSFFSEKLYWLGLRGKEIFDFKSYWLGKLNDKPYYRISFLEKSQFDIIAPLDISPIRPDSVIRVMMTAKGLDRFENMPVQKISPPAARIGFTAVEWGGAILK